MFISIFVLFHEKIIAQERLDASDAPFLNTIIEDFLDNSEDGQLDPVLLLDQLNDFIANPLDLNNSKAEQFTLLFFLTDNEIQGIMKYREFHGPFISVYELQAVPELSNIRIRQIRPFVTVSKNAENIRPTWREMLLKGRNELFLRTERIVEDQAGYDPTLKDANKTRYLGDPFRYYLRFRHQFGNQFSAFVLAEKDPGEQFFSGKDNTGFDFYTAHLFARNLTSWLPAVAIGDYNISMGQGLILHSGFGYGKSTFSTLIKKAGPTLTPYTSTLENTFFRGAAATLKNKSLELTLFGSHRKLDANITQPDSVIDFDIAFSSFQQSGFHRTQAEIDDKDAISATHLGGVLKQALGKKGYISANLLYSSFDEKLQRDPRPDNIYAFSGRNLMNTSLDYSYIWRNFHFFGEFAKSNTKSIASVNGLIISLDRKVDLAILNRSYPVDYQALNPSAFAESTNPSNESGVYIGMKIMPNRHWTIDIYSDVWKHPWLRFTSDAPTGGNEQLIKIQYSIKRKLDLYLQIRNETKGINAGSENAIIAVNNQNRLQVRCHLNHKLSKRLEMRYRTEWSFFEAANGTKSKGFLIYQDILYKPIDFPTAFTARLAYFDTDDFNSRIFAFENDILYSFSIPAYNYNGIRWYLNTRTRVNSWLTVEGAISQTILTNRESFGSGLEQINQPSRTEAKLQMKIVF